MKKILFGETNGRDVYLYTLTNEHAEVSVSSYGATVVSFKPFGVDIIGGYDSLEDYIADTSNQGATVGRVANRIEGAEFTMDGAVYMLPANNNGNCLHSGCGFHRRVWEVEEVSENSILLSYYSEDGEEGFPSGLMTRVRFTLIDTALVIEYEAVPDGKTPIALTNHSYFNLDGFGGTVLEHTAKIYADKYTEVNERLIPTGSRPSVGGTVFDFTEPHRIGERVGGGFEGYDHNFILSPTVCTEFLGKQVGLGAEVENEAFKLSFYTDQPGVQFYIANFLGGEPDFRGGIKRIKHGGFCLEAQTEPNCIKHGEGFYEAGEKYTQTTVYKVSRKI